MFHAIRRLVAKSGREELVGVLQAARHFVREMEPYLAEHEAESRELVGPRSTGGSNGNGSGSPGGDDTLREEYLGGVPGEDVLTGLLHEAERDPALRASVGSGHEAEMESDNGGNGSVDSSTLQGVREG